MDDHKKFIFCAVVGALLTVAGAVTQHLLDSPRPRRYHPLYFGALTLLWPCYSVLVYAWFSDVDWRIDALAVAESVAGGLAFVSLGVLWATALRAMSTGKKFGLGLLRKMDVFMFVFLWVMFSALMYARWFCPGQ